MTHVIRTWQADGTYYALCSCTWQHSSTHYPNVARERTIHVRDAGRNRSTT